MTVPSFRSNQLNLLPQKVFLDCHDLLKPFLLHEKLIRRLTKQGKMFRQACNGSVIKMVTVGVGNQNRINIY